MEENKNQVVAPVEEQTQEVVTNNSFKEIIRNLMASGNCRRINNLRIRNITPSEEDNYTRVALTLADKIPARITKDEGATYELGERNVLFTSSFAISAILKENEDLAFMANTLRDKPNALNVILTGGTVDIIQQEVKEGESYHNPFTTKEEDEIQDVVFDHDTIINYVVGIKLGKAGQKYADILAVKMLGF